MAGVNKSSSLFCRKVRNQVLKNNTRRNKYNPKCYEFEEINSSEYASRNDFRTFMFKTNESVIPILEFYGPKDYSWKDEAKCYFFDQDSYEYVQTILAIPHIWLEQYDPTIPIISRDWFTTCYLDLKEHRWSYSLSYLLKDRFYREGFKYFFYPSSKGPIPYSIRKGDEDWCITHLKLYPSCMINCPFQSFLLIKNIDFSVFDAKVKAEGLKCPAVPYGTSIKNKDKPKIRLSFTHHYTLKNDACFCIDCRKDYRAFEVRVWLFKKRVNLFILDPII